MPTLPTDQSVQTIGAAKTYRTFGSLAPPYDSRLASEAALHRLSRMSGSSSLPSLCRLLGRQSVAQQRGDFVFHGVELIQSELSINNQEGFAALRAMVHHV